MSIMPGHENLKPREILGLGNNGNLLVEDGDKIKEYKMYVMPNGGIHCKPVEHDNGYDQEGPRQDNSKARRWASVDQIG